jgi:hypothetical protein
MQLLRRLLPTWALLAAAVLLPADGRAEGVTLTGNLSYQGSKSDTKFKATGEEIDGDSSRFTQLYNIELRKQLFPYLGFRTGALLTRDNNRTTTEDIRTKLTRENQTYFFELDLTNPIYRAGFTYRDIEDSVDGTRVADQKILRDEYTTFINWRPDALPSVDVNYRYVDVRDKPRTRETVGKFLNLNTRYDFYNLGLDYTYLRTDRDDRLRDLGQLDEVHDGSLDYTTTLLGGRVSANGGSQLIYRTSDPSGGESVRLQTSPFRDAFFLLDDSTPENNTPGEFTTVGPGNPLTTVDIGGGGPLNLVSFGVEFASPTRVDTVYALPLEDPMDPSLASPAEIDAVADRFSWRVFSSDDQEFWREQRVTRATYDAFENRFEISFSSSGNPRYIKVATEPLSGGPTRSILISELQTFETAGGGPGETFRSFRQVYNLGLRSELSPDTTSFFDTFYQVEDLDPGDKSTLLTNSIGLRHSFGPRLGGSARYMRSLTRRPDADTVNNSFVASLRADHLDTFYQTLTYSFIKDSGDLGSGNTHSVWLRNNAVLHPSWSASLDLGYFRKSSEDRPTDHGPTSRIISSLRPNRWMNFNLDYTFQLTKSKHEGTRRQHKWSFQAFIVPTDKLSMFALLSYNDDGRSDHEFDQTYSASWLPFGEGDLDFSLAYHRTKRRSGADEEAINSELGWQIRRGLRGVLRYRIGTSESDVLETDFSVFSAELQFFFR